MGQLFVSTSDKLPTGAQIGQVALVTSEVANYRWDGSQWQKLDNATAGTGGIEGGSGSVDLTGYLQTANFTTTLENNASFKNKADKSELTNYATKTALSSLENSIKTKVDSSSLSEYAKTSDLSSYVKSDTLGTTLDSYAKTSDLSSYVKSDTLGTTLDSYAKTSDLSSYVKSGDKKIVICCGDSFGALSYGWPTQLQDNLGNEYEIRNFCVSGAGWDDKQGSENTIQKQIETAKNSMTEEERDKVYAVMVIAGRNDYEA